MGDDFIQKKNQSFKHQAEKMHDEEFGSVTLFDAVPEEARRLVRFRCPSGNPTVGEFIAFVDVPGKDKVRVMLGTAMIGEADAASSKEVRSLLAEHPSLHGILPAQVVASKDISGFCKAQLGAK